MYLPLASCSLVLWWLWLLQPQLAIALVMAMGNATVTLTRTLSWTSPPHNLYQFQARSTTRLESLRYKLLSRMPEGKLYTVRVSGIPLWTIDCGCAKGLVHVLAQALASSLASRLLGAPVLVRVLGLSPGFLGLIARALVTAGEFCHKRLWGLCGLQGLSRTVLPEPFVQSLR